MGEPTMLPRWSRAEMWMGAVVVAGFFVLSVIVGAACNPQLSVADLFRWGRG